MNLSREHKVKVKENEKQNKYLDLSWELKNVEHESESNTVGELNIVVSLSGSNGRSKNHLTVGHGTFRGASSIPFLLADTRRK